MASLVQAAAELSDELAAHEGAYEAMMENADRLADALNKIYTEKDDEDI
jgi:glutamate-1-semialdehyde aminotransferase